MITVGMNYNVIPGRQQEFVDKFDSVLAALRDADGHIESHVYQDVHNDCGYLIVSEWADQATFMDYIRSPDFRAVTDWGKAEILTGRPKHTIYKPGQGGM